MYIRTLWQRSEADDEMPWLVASVDEYVIDNLNGDLPDDYKEALKDKDRRELVINFPESAVTKLFLAGKVTGQIEEK